MNNNLVYEDHSDPSVLNYATNINEFTDKEIREHLHYLGFKNISEKKFMQFKKDLEKLISNEIKTSSSNNFINKDILNRQKTLSSDNLDSKRANFINHDEMNLNLKSVSYDDQDNLIKYNKNKRVTFPNDSQIVKSSSFANVDESKNENHSSYNNEDELDQSFASITTTSSVVDNKVIKRKIIRKSVNSNKPTSSFKNQINDLDKNFQKLKLPNDDCKSHDDSTDTIKYNDDEVDENLDEPELGFCSDGEQMIKLNEFYPAINYPVKSFIRSKSALSSISSSSMMTSRSRSSHLKSNPVQRYQQYKNLWNKQKMPGEKKHNDLRWSIREQMLEKHVIVKKQPKTLCVNTYIIPTEKKRQQLRWLVRNSLANTAYD